MIENLIENTVRKVGEMRETNNKSKNLEEMMNVDHYRSTLIPANLQGYYSQSFKADIM